MGEITKADADHPGAVLVTSDALIERRDDVGIVSDVIEILEERLDVSKRLVVSGTVRVSTRTETYEQIAEITLDRDAVDVSRVPIGRVVDVMPVQRMDGDTTIVPVVEERFVVVKQLYLKEELHIRRNMTQDVSRVPIQLRRQTAIVERLDGNGHAIKGTHSD